MPKIVIDTVSIGRAVSAVRGIPRRTKPAKVAAVASAGIIFAAAVRKNVGISPIGGSPESHYTALAALDHPYAARHGAIQIRPSGGTAGIDPTQTVHSVTGQMARSLFATINVRRPAFEVGFNTAQAPHARYVIQGTRVMLGRDVLTGTLNDRGVRRAMRQEVVRIFGQVFRTQIAIRF